ncbi:hypothetical protein Y032_0193g1382 [Ancylostoma ceylanicum]|uniref:Peptidase M13 N-terminal domain-containing protein n=2 Tax=Ancylostoma ceylanicum TaxID=53326 RepID=A0A016SPD1_9BILA|nr:hypothetical protein Y032_0193g1382 [Ancylostoma ceylanicum]
MPDKVMTKRQHLEFRADAKSLVHFTQSSITVLLIGFILHFLQFSMLDQNVESAGSKAMKIAQLYYKSCLASGKELPSESSPIQLILGKIRQFGSFPLIDKTWSYGNKLDITALLTYFNQNRTATTGLVPDIRKDMVNSTRARIYFEPTDKLLHTIILEKIFDFDSKAFVEALGNLVR